MALMQHIQRGKTHMPPRILIYGVEGVGKSATAAQAPNPIFIQTEDGLGEIDCDKFPLPSRSTTLPAPSRNWPHSSTTTRRS